MQPKKLSPNIYEEFGLRSWRERKETKTLSTQPVSAYLDSIKPPKQNDKSWVAKALCHNRTDEFFPNYELDEEVLTNSEQKKLHMAAVYAAKKICEQCPVLLPCRSWALSMGNQLKYGVAGGLTATERRRLYRKGVRE